MIQPYFDQVMEQVDNFSMSEHRDTVTDIAVAKRYFRKMGAGFHQGPKGLIPEVM